MALRKILTEPNKVLREKSLKVESVDKDLQNLMDDMLETMYAAPGIGLAAIQVGIPKRIIVLDISYKEGKKNPMYFVNPEIIEKSNKYSTFDEGCFSVPGMARQIGFVEKRASEPRKGATRGGWSVTLTKCSETNPDAMLCSP